MTNNTGAPFPPNGVCERIGALDCSFHAYSGGADIYCNKATECRELRAREANSPNRWDALWGNPASAGWREKALAHVYDRIASIVPKGSAVVDLGGGIGALGELLQARCSSPVTVVDTSLEACAQASERGLDAFPASLSQHTLTGGDPELLARIRAADVLISTETLEHLTQSTRHQIFGEALALDAAIFSVPNNRLGPEVEPQHTIQWTALEFLRTLREHFGARCRVEVMGGYLLGVCGKLADKPFRLSVCFPARNEAQDIERTLASFRGVADELVIGIDPRSEDRTEEIARQYADKVFTLTAPEGPQDDRAPDGGVHFAHIRNQCLEECTGDFVFMTEAHESLKDGQDVLLRLNEVVPDVAPIAFVMRTGEREQWAFPWITRPHLRYINRTHNIVDYPANCYAPILPQVKTYHKRHADNAKARQAQRKVQNRKVLMEDWLRNGSALSLHYLGAEWREFDWTHGTDKAIEKLEEVLSLPARHGPMRYHTRLILAKQYYQRERVQDAINVLLPACVDDWTRTDHWLWLGDIHFNAGRFEQALQFYRYAATAIGNPPPSFWWIDLDMYGYLPAQRLTMTYAQLGMGQEALHWARMVVELMPEDWPEPARQEAQENVQHIERVLADAA